MIFLMTYILKRKGLTKMAKKKISLDNLNINLKIDDNVAETVTIDDNIPLETIENSTVLFNNQKYRLVKSDKPGVSFELVLNKDYLAEKSLKQNKLRAIKISYKPDKIQSGVCFDLGINILIKNYLNAYNTQNKKIYEGLKVTKLKKVDFTDIVLYNFFKQNNIHDDNIKNMPDKKLNNIKKELFDYTLSDNAYEQAMFDKLFDKSNQGLYATLELFDILTVFSIKTIDKKGTSLILNAIFRDFFIRYCGLKPDDFLNMETIKNYEFKADIVSILRDKLAIPKYINIF